MRLCRWWHFFCHGLNCVLVLNVQPLNGYSHICKTGVSSVSTLSRRVPQGSVLGPIIFFHFHISIHCFADNLQLCRSNQQLRFYSGTGELSDIQSWLEINFINLNKSETEIILIGQSNLLDGYDGAIGLLTSNL